MVLASLCFAVMGVFVKQSVRDVPFLVAVFFRAFVGFVTLFVYFRLKGAPLGATQHWLLLLRSVVGFLALTFFFFALEYLPLSTAVILNFSSPVFVVILSGFILHEKRTGRILPFVGAAFLGATLLVSPDLSSINIAAVLGLASAFFAAVAYISVRRLSRTESSATIVLYFSMYASILGLISLMVASAMGIKGFGLNEMARALADPVTIALLCGVGLVATLGQIFLTSAFALERASVVSGFSYLNPLLSYILGLVLFDEVPTAAGLIGGMVVIVSCLGVLMVSHEPVKHPA
ncbi:MAG: DMT family transporter [Deltaproteobacteria bacterium]|nr:DMT family transporter [Deltaproteobacteria bacterium]